MTEPLTRPKQDLADARPDDELVPPAVRGDEQLTNSARGYIGLVFAGSLTLAGALAILVLS